MFCSILCTRFSLESVFIWCGPHRDTGHGEGTHSGPLVPVQGLRGQSGGQGTIQHWNKQVGSHGCQQLFIRMLSAHHCFVFFCVLFFCTHSWSIIGLLCLITLWSAAAHQDCHCLSVFSVTDPPPTVLFKSCCGWNHSTVGFLSQVMSGRPLLSPLALIRPPISLLSQACSCGRQTTHSQQLLWVLSAPNVAKHAISVPGEKKVVSSLTLSNNVSLYI